MIKKTFPPRPVGFLLCSAVRQYDENFDLLLIKIQNTEYIAHCKLFQQELRKTKNNPEVSAESAKVKEITVSENFCLHYRLKLKPFGFFQLSGLVRQKAMKISSFCYLTVQTINNFKPLVDILQNQEISDLKPNSSRTKIVRHHFYLSAVEIQDFFAHGVLKRLVSCIEDTRLAF